MTCNCANITRTVFVLNAEFLKLKRNIDSYSLLKEGKQWEVGTTNAQNWTEQFRQTKVISRDHMVVGLESNLATLLAPRQSTLQLLGFTSNEIIECFQIVAFILKLANVNFLRKANIDSTEGCTVLADYGMQMSQAAYSTPLTNQ